MAKILLLTLSLVLTSCFEKDEPLDGVWSLKLRIQNKEIPFQLHFQENQKVDLHNGAEVINLGYDLLNDIVLIPILNFDALLELKQDGSTITGNWIKPNREPEFRVPVTGTKVPAKIKVPKLGIPEKWKIELSDKDKTKEGILLFTQRDDYTFASVLTRTGDYRFLTPKKSGDSLVLYGFDGVFSFFFDGKLSGEIYEGTMYSGISSQKSFKAKVNPDFELPDPTKTTTLAGNLSDVYLKKLNGKTESLINESNKDKVKVFQVFGSWCPNCIDETRFIKKWRERNKDKDVSFSIIAFERSPNKKEAIKQLKKTKKMLAIDYPIYIGGLTSGTKVEEVLPQLKNFISFPTTLILDKNNRVRKIHAGFSGPATGKYYEDFMMEFDSTIDRLLKE
ncbi:MAG: hypothetical protein CME64_04785 [Halobacteriovoraceae bacterium]|nr:hypothetical protein [Halobacteriovoraceae bacterium]|tara:strand:+ start:247682 stop:248857 length:1176 start_codon:yes stop_codon:yes gene_type:complete